MNSFIEQLLKNKYVKILNSFTLKSSKIFPLYLLHLITYSCNSNCSYCYLKNNKKPANPGMILEFTRKLGYLKSVTLSGGEPFLSHDLEIIVESYIKYNHCHEIIILSNGTLAEKIANFTKKILRNHHKLHLTYIFSVQENGKNLPTLKKLIGNLKSITTDKLKININLCITKKNQNILLDLKNHLKKELKIDSIRYSIQRNKDKTMDKAVDIKNVITLHGLCDTYEEKFMVDSYLAKDKCLAPLLKPTITPEGNVMSCEFGTKLLDMKRNPYFEYYSNHKNLKMKLEKLTHCQCNLECNAQMNYIHASFFNLINYKINSWFFRLTKSR